MDFLSGPANTGGAPVKRIDTHLSHVFLAGDRAWKLLRDIRYEFADFSTAEKRRRALENEFAVNRRFAPELYLGVAPVHRTPTGMAWAGGEPFEWVLEMARFDEGAGLDRLVARGALTREDVVRLADKIADLHHSADAICDRKLGEAPARVISQLSPALAAQLGGDETARWTRLARDEYTRLALRLAARAHHGRVRRCHGDLHLGNICIFAGAPTPFDAIAFNDELTSIDVLYDLSFLLMDLSFRGRSDLSVLLLNRYLGATRDYSGCGLLPLFLSLRAAVRAMVLSIDGRKERDRRQARRYLALAMRFLESKPPARVIAIGGYSGTGKSHLASLLAHALGEAGRAAHLQSDVIRKRRRGLAPETRLSEDGYSEEASAAVYQQMRKDGARALCAGTSAIFDATFLGAREREAAASVAARLGLRFDGLWLTAPHDILFNRVEKRRGDPSDATRRVLEHQIASSQEPSGWRVIDTNATDPLEEALRILAITER